MSVATSPIGAFKLNANGDTNQGAISFYQIKGGQAVFKKLISPPASLVAKAKPSAPFTISLLSTVGKRRQPDIAHGSRSRIRRSAILLREQRGPAQLPDLSVDLRALLVVGALP